MCNDSMYDIHPAILYAQDTVGIMSLVFFLVGTPLNIIICVLGIKISRKENYTSQVLVVSLSSADIIVTAVYCPLQFGKYALDAHYGVILCRIYFYSIYVGSMSSSLSLLMLNADKLLHVQWPLHYKVLVTSGRLKVSLVICWFLSIACCGVFLHEPGTTFVNASIGCAVNSTNIATYTTFTTLLFIVPIVLSFIFSCRTIYVIWERKRHQKMCHSDQLGRLASGKLRVHVGACTMNATAEIVTHIEHNHTPNSPEEPLRSPTRKKKRSHTKSTIGVATLLVFSTTIWSTVTALPYRIVYILVKALDLVKEPTCASGPRIAILILLLLLLPLNAVFNPLITLLTQSVYCRALRDTRRRRSRFSSSWISGMQQTNAMSSING